jgi:hypothetical protein
VEDFPPSVRGIWRSGRQNGGSCSTLHGPMQTRGYGSARLFTGDTSPRIVARWPVDSLRRNRRRSPPPPAPARRSARRSTAMRYRRCRWRKKGRIRWGRIAPTGGPAAAAGGARGHGVDAVIQGHRFRQGPGRHVDPLERATGATHPDRARPVDQVPGIAPESEADPGRWSRRDRIDHRDGPVHAAEHPDGAVPPNTSTAATTMPGRSGKTP